MTRANQVRSRRDVLKLFGGATMLAAVPGLVLGADEAAASVAWCRTDPIVEIDGKRLHIYVWSYQDDLHSLVTGQTEVVVTVPKNTSTQFIWADDGFGYGYSVSFQTSKSLTKDASGIDVRVSAYVPASKTQPVVVDLERAADGAVLDSETGQTNRTVTATGRL